LINTHIHLDFREVKHSLLSPQIVIVPSIGRQNWEKVSIYKYFALGIHPWHVEEHLDFDLKLLENEIRKKSPIAIGECGLDFSSKRKFNCQKQVRFFKYQINLARKFKLPIIIHSVKSNYEVIKHLKGSSNCGVIHAFYGSQEEADKLISIGFYLGIGHAVLKKNYQKMKSIIQTCPIEKILIETDDNDPEDLPKIASKISSIKGLSYDETVLICDKNAKKLFGI